MSDVKLPIDFKYFRLEVGETPAGSVGMGTYNVINKDTGVVEMSIPCLEDAYKSALALDRGREMMEMYYSKNHDSQKHLENIVLDGEQEEDPLEGMLLPGEAKLVTPGSGTPLN